MYRSPRQPMRRRRLGAVTLISLVVAAGALSACGSSSSSGTPTTSASNPVDEAILGPDQPTSGTPVKLGYAYDGQSPVSDTTDQIVAARAVVKYANAKLGGVAGHPIQLVECATNYDPATSCGDKFVSSKAIAVAGAQLVELPAVTKALHNAAIPYMDSEQAVTGSLDTSVSSPLLALGAPAVYAKKQGITKVTLIFIDIGAAVGEAKGFATGLFAKEGASVNIVGVPPGTADMTPQIQAAAGGKPGLYEIVGDAPFCSSALKAIRTLGIKTPVSGIAQCLSKSSAASIPGGYAGMTIFSGISLDPANAETKLYDAVASKYLSGEADNGNYEAAYQSMLSLIRALNVGKITDLTPAGVSAALLRMPETPIPLGGGITYACNRKKVLVQPAACSTGTIVSTATADGGQQNFSVLDDPTLYN